MNEEQQHRLALPQGTRIRDFEFHRVLGHGGFGITYLGWNIALDIPVAIKEYLPADLATREQDLSVVPQTSQAASDFQWGLERFLDEARTLARFQHPNIVRVHHFFEAHNTAYIAMDYVEGEDLSAYLTRRGTLSEDELKGILYPLLDALEVVHQADFLHRDIKPGNIVLRDSDGSPVLLDFGAARQAIGAKSRSVTSIVTPGYAPIEQYSSRGDQGPWTDIYALGGVCYRALTGQVPEDATDRVRHDPLIPVSQRCAGRVSDAFLSAIDLALSVDEGDRPQSVGAWREVLEADAAEGERWEARDAPDVRRREPVVAPSEPVVRGRRAMLNGPIIRKNIEDERKTSGRTWFIVFVVALGVVGIPLLLVGGIVDEQRREEQAVLEKQRREQAALEKQRREQAALERQRREQTALEKQRREQAVLEKQRREQAVLEKQRQEQAALEKQRREQAVLKKAGVYRLHDAASKNAYEAAKVLMNRGADVHARDRNGNTPLHDAAEKNAFATAELLLKQGADIHAKNNKGSTPLHNTGFNNAFATAELLLKQGADIHAKNKYGNTPLHRAAVFNASATAEVLLKGGADVKAKNNKGSTPLHEAAQYNAFVVAEVLLKGGADVKAKNNDGRTPLYYAVRGKAYKIAEVLRHYGGRK